MIDLALSILNSTLILVIFKWFDVFRVRTLNAIIFNYITACTVGLFLYRGKVDLLQIAEASWAWVALAMGVLFICIFNLMAITSQKAGVSVASVATKMSLAIPVLVGVFLYGDRLSLLQGLGILLALAAVFLASLKEDGIKIGFRELLLPLLVFLGSGIIDASIKYFEHRHLSEAE